VAGKAQDAVARWARNEVDSALVAEFPELVADNTLMDKGKRPKHEITRRTAIIFQKMVDAQPGARTDPGCILLAARQARSEMQHAQ
jgi:hypothetical protein